MQVGGPLNGREGSGGLLAQFQAPEIPKDFYAQADFVSGDFEMGRSRDFCHLQ